MSVRFPSVHCDSPSTASAIKDAVKKKLLGAFSEDSLGSCFKNGPCEIVVDDPDCAEVEGTRGKRSADGLAVSFTLTLREHGNKADESFLDAAEQHSRALFQLKYVVSTGQMSIPFRGSTITAERASFKEISSSYSCAIGYIIGDDGKKCGKCFWSTPISPYLLALVKPKNISKVDLRRNVMKENKILFFLSWPSADSSL